MVEDQLGYRRMAQEALRDVVRQALIRVASDDGLPGAHHFYITFDSTARGVDLDEDLSRQFPERMTVVLEHQFWDLGVDDEAFEVTLKFAGVPKYIRVPFAAIVSFHDPSVDFTLRFDLEDSDGPARLVAGRGEASDDGEDESATRSATVVSLDAFRKKPN